MDKGRKTLDYAIKGWNSEMGILLPVLHYLLLPVEAAVLFDQRQPKSESFEGDSYVSEKNITLLDCSVLIRKSIP